jgi:AbrB family looped-hinge helix DNA binding protein
VSIKPEEMANLISKASQIIGEALEEKSREEPPNWQKLRELLSQKPAEEPRIFPAKVLKDGRVTIPVEWRELLNIREGDILKLQILEIHRKPAATSKTSTKTP